MTSPRAITPRLESALAFRKSRRREVALRDAQVLVFSRGLPCVDPERVGVLGICMGGGYAVSLGARDKRLKAVVAAVASLEPYFIYNSIAHAPLVAPTPLQIVHGTRDTALLPEFAQQAYDAAVGPKELVWIEAHNHIELYDQDPYVTEACRHGIRWLDTFLERRRP